MNTRYGASDRTWTCTEIHQNLNLARLPISPHSLIGFENVKQNALFAGRFVVRITGLEPACNCLHMDLNHTRLPIPPYPHIWSFLFYSKRSSPRRGLLPDPLMFVSPTERILFYHKVLQMSISYFVFPWNFFENFHFAICNASYINKSHQYLDKKTKNAGTSTVKSSATRTSEKNYKPW